MILVATDLLFQTDIESGLSFKKKTLTITKENISHGDRSYNWEEVKGVIIKVKSNTVIGSIGEMSREYSIEIGFKNGQNFDFLLMSHPGNKSEVAGDFEEFYKALDISYFMPKAEKWFNHLKEGKSIKIDEFTLRQSGITIKTGGLFRKTKEHDVNWPDLTWKIDKTQFLVLNSISNPKAKNHISTETDFKAAELKYFLDHYAMKL